MRSLQTVAMGLVIVFLDVGSDGWDWVADPVGWVLVLMGLAPAKERLPSYPGLVGSAWVCLVVSVLTLPPDSVDAIAPTLGWLFSLPTIAFGFLLCDSLADVTENPLARWFRWLRVLFVVVAALPGLVYLGGLESLAVAAAVAAVLTNVVLVPSVWAAGDEDEDDGRWPRDQSRRPEAPQRRAVPAPAQGGRRKKEQGFSAEEVRRRARARRAEQERARKE